MTDESYKDKLRSLAFPRKFGGSNTKPVLHDRTGEQVGSMTEHWSGQVDATATKFTVTPNPNLIAKREEV